MTIDLLPSSPTNRSVYDLLADTLSNCQSVRGSIAFWTLPVGALGRQLFSALCRPESSICVDFHIPTNFDHLTDFVQQIRGHRVSPSLFVFLKKAVKSNNSDSPVMLHTKILLFDMGNQNWQIWIGSHNFTGNALHGLNLEGSICIKGSSDEPGFCDLLIKIKSYLIYIQSLCEHFDPERVPVYKSLRGEDVDINIADSLIRRILTLQSEAANSLAGQTIILLGNLREELGSIRSKNRGGSLVLLRVRDVITKKQYTYEAYLRATDYVDNVASSDVVFKQRRWAYREIEKKSQKISPPFLQPSQDVDNQLIERSGYYVNIQIIGLVNKGEKVSYFTYPETNSDNLWEPVRRFAEETHVSMPDFDDHFRNADADFAYQVPRQDVEELISISPIEWTDDFIDGILEKQIVVFEK